MAAYLLAMVSSMVGTVLQRISGTGIALVAAPFLAAFFGPVDGILITNLINGTASLLLCLAVLKEVDWKLFAGLALFAFGGEWVGGYIVEQMPASWMQLVVGGTVVLAMLATWLSGKNLPHINIWIALPMAGFLGGILMSTAGLGAPATVIFARLIRWEQRAFAATMQPLFSVMAYGAFFIKHAMGVSLDLSWLQPMHLGVFLLALVVAVVIGNHLALVVSAKKARDLAFLLAGSGAMIAMMKGLLGILL